MDFEVNCNAKKKIEFDKLEMDISLLHFSLLLLTSIHGLCFSLPRDSSLDPFVGGCDSFGGFYGLCPNPRGNDSLDPFVGVVGYSLGARKSGAFSKGFFWASHLGFAVCCPLR